jgi:hypothetical protein
LNLDKAIKILDDKIHHVHFDDDALVIDPLTKAELDLDQPMIDHLAEHHIEPVIKWKLAEGLETKIKVGNLFKNYGEDFEHLTIEEEEWFRLLKRRDEAYGFDPKTARGYKF